MPTAWPEPDPPRLSGATPSETEPRFDADGDLRDVWLAGTRIVGVESEGGEVVDVRLDGCAVSGFTNTEGVLRRALVQATRLRAVMFASGVIDDVVIDDCNAEQLSLRFSRLRRVVFRNCRLPGIDLYAARFTHVRFEHCDLTRANFQQAAVTSLRFVDCDFTGVTGATRLSGADVDLADLPLLAPSLAREAGIILRGSDDAEPAKPLNRR